MTARGIFFNELRRIHLGNDAIKEIILVFEGAKPSARLTVNEPQIRALQDLLGGYGIHAAESEHCFTLKKDVGKGGFGNKALLSDDAGSGVKNRYFYIAGSRKKVGELRDMDGKSPDRLGESLGYPGCCRRFYEKYCGSARQKQFDFTLYTLSETVGDYPYDLYNNNVSRYFGYSLISHFPCSFNCEESSGLAKEYYGILKEYSRKWADMFVYCQGSAVIYTEYRGIFLIKNFEVHGNTVEYGKSSWLYSTIINKNLDLLGKGDNIYSKSKNNFSIRIGDRILKTFKGENVGLMVFGER